MNTGEDINLVTDTLEESNPCVIIRNVQKAVLKLNLIQFKFILEVNLLKRKNKIF